MHRERLRAWLYVEIVYVVVVDYVRDLGTVIRLLAIVRVHGLRVVCSVG